MKRMIIGSVVFACLFSLNMNGQFYTCPPPPQIPPYRACDGNSTGAMPFCSATFTAVANGNWSAFNSGVYTTWGTTRLPGSMAGDCVMIPAGRTVTYDVTVFQTSPIAQLLINGTLRFKTDGLPIDEYQLKAYFIGVNDAGAGGNGNLQVGKPADFPNQLDPEDRFPSKATIRLYGLQRECYVNNRDDYQPCNGGLQVNTWGSWVTKINSTLTYQANLGVDTGDPGQTPVNSIMVTGNLTGSNGWNIGDLLVLTSTEYVVGACPVCPGTTECPQDENELLRVSAAPTLIGGFTTVPIVRISPPGGTGPGLLFAHNPIQLNLSTKIGKVNRPIKIESDPASTESVTPLNGGGTVPNQLRPSNTLVSPTANIVKIYDVEFHNLGVTDAVQLYNPLTIPPRALYALHLHNMAASTDSYRVREVINSSFHTDYLCTTGDAACPTPGLSSPNGGFQSQLVMHRMRNGIASNNVFYNPVPMVGNGRNGSSLYAVVVSSEVDANTFSDNLTINDNLVVTDPTNSCTFGVPCEIGNNSCPASRPECGASCKPFVSALYVQSARHAINRNFVSGGYYGIYGVIDAGLNPTGNDGIITRCTTFPTNTPPTQCDMASFADNIAVGAVNDNFRYDNIFVQTTDLGNVINVVKNLKTYLGSSGITVRKSTLTSTVPRIIGWTSRGLRDYASRSPLPIEAANPNDCSAADLSNCPNQVFGKPYFPFSIATETGVAIGGDPVEIKGLAIWNDFNQNASRSAIAVGNNLNPDGYCLGGPTATHLVSNWTFRPDTDVSSSLYANRIMSFTCKEDGLFGPPVRTSCIQFCNYTMALSGGTASGWFPQLQTAVGQPNNTYINFVTRPAKTSGTGFTCADYGPGFTMAPVGFANTTGARPDICVANTTVQTCGYTCSWVHSQNVTTPNT